MWDALSGTALSTLQGTSRCLTWSPTGDRLITGVGQASMRMWDTSERPLRLLGHETVIIDGKWSPDGERIVTSSFDGTARVWDAASGANSLVYRNHQQEGANPVVGEVNYAPDGVWVVTHGGDMNVRVWNSETGEDRYVFPLFGGHVFSPDGSRFAIVGDERFIVVDYSTGEFLLDFDPGFGGPCFTGRLSWSPDGRYIITPCGFQPRADIWDAQTGEHVKTLAHVDATVNTTGWSPDGKHILTAGEKGIVHIWDGESFEPLYDFKGHTSLIFDAEWSPDGSRIASSDDTGMVRIWDAETRQEVNSYNVGFGVLDVNWSPEGTGLISVGFQPIPDVRPVWPSTEELIEYAYECCVSRELTPEERVQFGLPPR
jgi:WD40 repeat protein